MKCPHCTHYIHESWFQNDIRTMGAQATNWCLRIMTCPQCNNDILALGAKVRTATHFWTIPEWTQIYPQGSNRGPVSPDVPKEIAEDYDEAALVLPFSPKASAALSRRCLQAVLRQAGYLQKDLSQCPSQNFLNRMNRL
jgi:hypothetical protein